MFNYEIFRWRSILLLLSMFIFSPGDPVPVLPSGPVTPVSDVDIVGRIVFGSHYLPLTKGTILLVFFFSPGGFDPPNPARDYGSGRKDLRVKERE